MVYADITLTVDDVIADDAGCVNGTRSQAYTVRSADQLTFFDNPSGSCDMEDAAKPSHAVDCQPLECRVIAGRVDIPSSGEYEYSRIARIIPAQDNLLGAARS